MFCPRCENVILDERDRSGVVIDACPSCRGIWLDRGELERLIARASGDDVTPSAGRGGGGGGGGFDRDGDSRRDRDGGRGERDRERRRDDDDDDDAPRGGFFGSLRNLFD